MIFGYQNWVDELRLKTDNVAIQTIPAREVYRSSKNGITKHDSCLFILSESQHPFDLFNID
jgi:hypothetical protein